MKRPNDLTTYKVKTSVDVKSPKKRVQTETVECGRYLNLYDVRVNRHNRE